MPPTNYSSILLRNGLTVFDSFEKMLYEEQRIQEPQPHQPQHQPGMVRASSRRTKVESNKGAIEEAERLQMVDLSGMSLETLPNPSLNLAMICKLDLSNNNLQVPSIHFYYCMPI